MEVKKTKKIDDRKPVAVIGSGDSVLFFQGNERVFKLSKEGITGTPTVSLTDLLDHLERKPVYEGETLEITF